MPRDHSHLIDILESALLALEYTSGLTEDAFLADSLCQDAVARRLEIIGEAAGKISAGQKAAIPDLEWKLMSGLRNRVIHQYDAVDWRIIWDTIRKDLPKVVATLEPLVRPEMD